MRRVSSQRTSVRLGELAQDTERDVLEVSDRRRADRERHLRRSLATPLGGRAGFAAAPVRFKGLEADEGRADETCIGAKKRRNDPDEVPPGRQRLLTHRPRAQAPGRGHAPG